ncbi:MAG: PilZ domain-containing protein [Thermodesulfobacteriota bacterium]
MDTMESARVFEQRVGTVEQGSGKERWLPPWLFKHHELTRALESAQTVSQQSLTNTLNHIHFINGHVLVLLKHPRFEEGVLLRARPEPCFGATLFCAWENSFRADLSQTNYLFLHLVIDDGRSMILVPGDAEEVDARGIRIRLPETSYAVGQRSARRYPCRNVDADLIQSGFLAKGRLMDFSPMGFKLKLRPDPSCSFRWFNSGEPFTIHLSHEEKMLFAGTCNCVRSGGGDLEHEVVATPEAGVVRRFKKKQIRNTRQRLLPSPTLTFLHPFLGKKVQMEVQNISTSGFSVYERGEERLLVPGMIIPEMTVNFAGALRIQCAAQVIYLIPDESGEGVRYGLAVLDMDIEAYSRLTHILTNALDPHAYISSEVDMDALWEFFFSTGFIYPKKYRLIQPHREEFKKTYEKLYLEGPEIARHFTYQKNGRIYGHISMVRAYERSWMIHHHAANAMDNRRTGFMVLKQIMHYLNDMYRLPSAKIDYVLCYFRPENKFPDRVFGGFARELNNPKGCSMDLFPYLPHTRHSVCAQLSEGWSLEESTPFHLWELRQSYSRHSGGLLMEALGLTRAEDRPSDKNLKKIYADLGFERSWKLYSLLHEGELNAVLIANQSDLGFNLSELLNGITILVTDPDGLPWSVLSVAISILAGKYRADRIPILFFPSEYVQKMGIPYEKQYQLWILNVQFGNEYLEYMQKRFRISYGQ